MNLSPFYTVGAGLIAIAVLSAGAARCRKAAPVSGCMAECPAAPPGCERTSVDPGACASECKTPAPVCHYGPTDAGAVCPPSMAGRCIPPN